MRTASISSQKTKAINKFLHYFPGGFKARKYVEWERAYKWNAHLAWEEKLNEKEFKKLLTNKQFDEIAKRAISLESKTNLLFSFTFRSARHDRYSIFYMGTGFGGIS